MWTEAWYVELDLEKLNSILFAMTKIIFLNITFLGYDYIQIVKYNRRIVFLMGIRLFLEDKWWNQRS